MENGEKYLSILNDSLNFEEFKRVYLNLENWYQKCDVEIVKTGDHCPGEGKLRQIDEESIWLCDKCYFNYMQQLKNGDPVFAYSRFRISIDSFSTNEQSLHSVFDSNDNNNSEVVLTVDIGFHEKDFSNYIAYNKNTREILETGSWKTFQYKKENNEKIRQLEQKFNTKAIIL